MPWIAVNIVNDLKQWWSLTELTTTQTFVESSVVRECVKKRFLITRNGNCEPKIRRIIGTIMNAVTELWKEITQQSCGYYICVPFQYSLCMWNMEHKSKDSKQLYALETWSYHRLLRILWTTWWINTSILRKHINAKVKNAFCDSSVLLN